jgi:hypothetical protein
MAPAAIRTGAGVRGSLQKTMTPPGATDQFKRYLIADERILWFGQPQQGLTLSARDTFLIPFSLLWGGFAIFWNIGVWTFPDNGQGGDWFFRLWGLPFLMVGLYVIFGRFWHDAIIRKRLIYAVTNQRVLVSRGLNSPKITSLDIHRLPKLELSEHGDGTGTIAFEGSPMFSGNAMNGLGWWVPALSGATQFFRVTNPRQVYEIIRKQTRI